MPVNTGRRPRRFNVKLINPNGPDVVRMVHNNITLNHRRRQDARIGLPSIVARSVMIVKQSRVMPIRIAEE